MHETVTWRTSIITGAEITPKYANKNLCSRKKTEKISSEAVENEVLLGWEKGTR